MPTESITRCRREAQPGFLQMNTLPTPDPQDAGFRRYTSTRVPDANCQAAGAVFDEKALVDLTIAVDLMNVYNRMAISFRNTPQATV